jgi:hypothetical protein
MLMMNIMMQNPDMQKQMVNMLNDPKNAQNNYNYGISFIII